MKRILILTTLLVGVLLLTSCSLTRSYKYEKRDFWLTNRYRALNYVDTTELPALTTSFVVDAAVAKAKTDYNAAIVNYQLALRTDTTAAILYSLAECFLLTERYDLAIEYGHTALLQEPAFLPAYEVICKAYAYLGDATNAILTLENALLMADSEPMLFFLANLYELQDTAKAAATYKQLVNNYGNKDALWRLINICRAGGSQISNAELTDIVRKRWQAEPDDYHLAINLVATWLHSGSPQPLFDNIDLLDQNLISSDLENIYNYVLNRLLTQDTMPANTKTLLNKIDQRFEHSTMLNLNATRAALKLNMAQAAEQFASIVLHSAEAADDIKLRLLLQFHHDGYTAEAKAQAAKLQAADTTNWRYPYWLGTLEMLNGAAANALLQLQRARQLDSTQEDVLLGLASTFMSLEKYDSADTIFEQLLAAAPDDPLLCNNFAFSLCQQNKDLDKALELAQIAISHNPASPEYLDTYGWIKYKQGHIAEAAEYIEKAAKWSGDETAEIYEHLAEVYHKLNNTTEARKAIQKALEIEPENAKLLEKEKLFGN